MHDIVIIVISLVNKTLYVHFFVKSILACREKRQSKATGQKTSYAISNETWFYVIHLFQKRVLVFVKIPSSKISYMQIR